VAGKAEMSNTRDEFEMGRRGQTRSPARVGEGSRLPSEQGGEGGVWQALEYDRTP
jgi:hypothetical protein